MIISLVEFMSLRFHGGTSWTSKILECLQWRNQSHLSPRSYTVVHFLARIPYVPLEANLWCLGELQIEEKE